MGLHTTPLHERHRALGARLVDFAGFEMPLQYAGILEEHRAVRERVGVFDVSHMGEAEVSGPGALDFLQHLLPNDLARLAPRQVMYSCMCHPDGGTVDDLLVYRLDGAYLLVLNAVNAPKDLRWMREHAAGFEVEIADACARYAQLAVQGPQAAAVVAGVCGGDAAGLRPFWSQPLPALGAGALISRTGYTGEDGFEIYCAPEAAVTLWDSVIEAGAAPIGLGARDSLRFEACLSLYGHELDRDITPVEAGLGWTVKSKAVNYLGRDVLLAQKADPPRRLVGLRMRDPGVARQGYPVFLAGVRIGTVTSGMKAPTLDAFLALALVDRALALGTGVAVEIRGTHKRAEVVDTPFYRRPPPTPQR